MIDPEAVDAARILVAGLGRPTGAGGSGSVELLRRGRSGAMD